jgi:hypothetical protein
MVDVVERLTQMEGGGRLLGAGPPKVVCVAGAVRRLRVVQLGGTNCFFRNDELDNARHGKRLIRLLSASAADDKGAPASGRLPEQERLGGNRPGASSGNRGHAESVGV